MMLFERMSNRLDHQKNGPRSSTVPAATILLTIAVIVVAVAVWDYARHGGGMTPARRTWLLVAAIFAGVSVLLQLLR